MIENLLITIALIALLSAVFVYSLHWHGNREYRRGFERGELHEHKHLGNDRWFVFDDETGTWFEDKESQ